MISTCRTWIWATVTDEIQTYSIISPLNPCHDSFYFIIASQSHTKLHQPTTWHFNEPWRQIVKKQIEKPKVGLETGRRVKKQKKTLITAYHFKSHLQSKWMSLAEKWVTTTSLIESNMHKKIDDCMWTWKSRKKHGRSKVKKYSIF